jgi:hypothetical protein
MGQRCATIPGDYDENGCDCPAVIGDWIVPVDAADGEYLLVDVGPYEMET